MNHKLAFAFMFSVGAGTCSSTPSHADVASDRVVLLKGPSGCPFGQVGFTRLRQSPDGSSVLESSEYQVPDGKYLEITNVEYTTPHSTAFATSYTQELDLYVRQRTGSAASMIFNAYFQNAAIYDEDDNYQFAGFGQYTGQGAQTHVASFPSGPLVGAQGRLCFLASTNFWNYGGSVKLRGRLIAADATMQPPGGGVVVGR